jgi:hypothetical protein
VAVGFDDVVRASSKEHVAAAAAAAAASADKLPRGLRSFQAVEGQSFNDPLVLISQNTRTCAPIGAVFV